MNQCTYKNFNPKFLTNLKPEQSKNQKVPCFFIPLMYNYGTEENPVFSEFEMELSEFNSNQGITEKPQTTTEGKPVLNAEGKQLVDESILAKFDLNNDDHVQCIETLKALHQRLAEIIYEVRGPIKKFAFKATDPVAGGFKELVYFPRDELTNEIISGRSPSMFLKLFSWKYGNNVNETIFVNMKNKPIDKTLLYGAELKFIPLMQIRRIRSAASFSLQWEIKSSVIRRAKEKNTESSQLATINRLKAENPEAEDQLENDLLRLAASRQNKPTQQQQYQQSQQDEHTEQTTVSGITPMSLSSSQIPTITNAVNKPPVRKDFKLPMVNEA